MIELLLFILTAVVVLVAGTMVVRSRDLVRSVFWLAGMSMSVAVIFVLLGSGFLGAVQVLLYTGGVVTLMLFGVMLTVKLKDARIPQEVVRPGRAAAIAGSLFVVLAAAILATPLPDAAGADTPVKAIGRAFLVDWMLPFEALSMLLLAAMVGAIVLARRSDPS